MIIIKQGDRRPQAEATLRRGTTVVDLTLAVAVTFKLRPINRLGLEVQGPATIVDAAAGQVEYRWLQGDTDNAGEYLAEWEVLWGDGTTETLPTLGYDVCLIQGELT